MEFMGTVRCLLQELNPYNIRRQDISEVVILRLTLWGLIFGRACIGSELGGLIISVRYGISFTLGKIKLARRSLEGSAGKVKVYKPGPRSSVSGVGRGTNHRTPYKLI